MPQYPFQRNNLYGPDSPYYDEAGQLRKGSKVYYYCNYLHYHADGNPDYINVLKNTFRSENPHNLLKAKELVRDILYQGILYVMEDRRLQEAVVVCAPRAKALETYAPDQLYFIDAVNEAAENAHQTSPGIINGTACIRRHTSTRTTHLRTTTSRIMANGRQEDGNGGPDIYPGICADTCYIDGQMVAGKTVILVDDIYTKSAHVDVDMMNALYDNGARMVYLLTVAKTMWRPDAGVQENLQNR